MEKIKMDKIILKNLTTFSFVFVALVATLYLYLIFLKIYGTNMKIYDIGILAGATGGIWGYIMTKLSGFRDKVHNMSEKEFYGPSFYHHLLSLNFLVIVVSFVLIVILRKMLGEF